MDLRSGECDVVSLYVLCCSVNGSVCFVCCVFVSVCEMFGETIPNIFGWSVILLLNVMELLGVVGGALLDRPFTVFQKCVCCASGPSDCLVASSICFVCVFVCWKISPHLRV